MKYLLSLLCLLPLPAFAHVKWFSNYDFQHVPLAFSQLTSHPAFWGLMILSLISLPLLVWADKAGERWPVYQNINTFLDQYADNGPLIMRVAMGAVLLMSWQGDSIIAPEIAISDPIWGWLQFGLALCLLSRKTTIITGIGIVCFYIWGLSTQGLFHMLDYVVYPAVGLYLIFSHLENERLRNLDLPVLYGGLGFSLCWVAFEKLVYPYWGLSVLAQAPALTMGLDHEFFLMACAFIEFTLGYLLIICLLHRPLAVVITLVFFITTSFFGKTEVVGHTILHGALLVFIVRGPGHYYQAPIRFHKSLWMRSLFAMVNFVILFVVLAFPYERMAKSAHARSMAAQAAMAHEKLEIPAGTPVPKVQLHVMKDSNGGWNMHLQTENFRFTPQNSGKGDVLGEGHAHLYINGKKVSRVYGEWFHTALVKGPNKIRVTLNSNTHKDYFVDGEQVEAVVEVEENREVAGHSHQH